MTLQMPETFKYEKQGKIAIMTINRPEAMNAFTVEMLAAMDAAFDDYQKDDDLWVAILTGTGDKSFCSGMDKPIITAVNGFCIAGGMEFMQGTDIRIAAEHAIFGLGEVRFGLVPAGGTHVRLPRQIPWAVAMELLLTGENLDAERAFDIGLINKIVPKEDLMDEAMKMAEKICRNSPLAVRTAKEIAVRQQNLEPAFVLEKALAARVFGSHDAQEGPKAFMERREPNFTGK